MSKIFWHIFFINMILILKWMDKIVNNLLDLGTCSSKKQDL